MFRKQHRPKPVAALKNSECRKFRAEIVQLFNIAAPEDGLLLVPDALQSGRFNAADEAGIFYLDPASGDPLWFTVGKGASSPIPTVYTLWKRPLLVSISTPAAALERISGGADLMIPGVISISNVAAALPINSLVAITKYGSDVPVAVGRLAVPLKELASIIGSKDEVKGKAVHVLHVYKDFLWAAGSKRDPPDELPAAQPLADAVVDIPVAEVTIPDAASQPEPSGSGSKEVEPEVEAEAETEATPEEVDSTLRLSLLQCISKTLSQYTEPLPCPASTFLSLYLQQSRPAGHPALDLKRSSHKTLSKFLKTVEKEGLLKFKDVKGTLMVMSVDPKHVEVKDHRPFRTVGDVEAKEKIKTERLKAEGDKVTPMQIRELWKPHGTAVALFEEAGKDSSALYTAQDIRTIINDYITSHSLVHPREPTYVITDDLFKNVLRIKGEEPVEFVERDKIMPKILEAMQQWYSIGEDRPKKGSLKPISIAIKMRGGHKAVTIITGFEGYGISEEFLAEELKRICASAATFGEIPSQAKGMKAMEVLVQGKHIAAVRNLLIGQGVPKRLIDESDQSKSKKKK